MQEIDKVEKEPGPEREKATLEEDQTERSYYYDDAHGYEEYDPDAVEDEQTPDT